MILHYLLQLGREMVLSAVLAVGHRHSCHLELLGQLRHKRMGVGTVWLCASLDAEPVALVFVCSHVQPSFPILFSWHASEKVDVHGYVYAMKMRFTCVHTPKR